MLRVKNHFQKTRLPETKTSFSKIMNKPLCFVRSWNQFLHRTEERRMNLTAADLLHRSLIFHKAQDKTWLLFNVLSTCLDDLLDCFHTHKTFYAKREKKKKIQMWRNIRPGSTDPRATTESKPAGAFFKVWLSLVMVCSLPRATSHRNITPVFLEVLTKKQDTTWWRPATAQQPLTPNVCVCFLFFVFFWTSLTVSCWLAVFRGKINTAANAPPRMRHDSQAALQDGRHHRYVGSVPQQTAVLQSPVLTEPHSLRDAAKF